MSCRMMDGGIGGLIVGTIIVGGVLYSCGPNIVVGAVGTTVYGVKSCIDKVRLIGLEKLKSQQTSEITVAYINWKVTCVKRDLEKDLNHSYAFAINMIPIIGGYLGLSAWNNPTVTAEEEAEDRFWKQQESMSLVMKLE